MSSNYTDKEKYFTHHKYGTAICLTSMNYLKWLPQIEAILQATNGYEYTQKTTRLVNIEVPNPDYDPDLDNVENYNNAKREQEPQYLIERQLRVVPLVERPRSTIIKYEPTYTLVLRTTNRYRANNQQLTRKEYPNLEYEVWLKKSNDT